MITVCRDGKDSMDDANANGTFGLFERKSPPMVLSICFISVKITKLCNRKLPII